MVRVLLKVTMVMLMKMMKMNIWLLSGFCCTILYPNCWQPRLYGKIVENFQACGFPHSCDLKQLEFQFRVEKKHPWNPFAIVFKVHILHFRGVGGPPTNRIEASLSRLLGGIGAVPFRAVIRSPYLVVWKNGWANKIPHHSWPTEPFVFWGRPSTLWVKSFRYH